MKRSPYLGCVVVALLVALPVVARAAPAPAPAPAAPRSSPESTLVQASDHYSFGRYEKVVVLLRPVVERGLLRGAADRIEALRLYGICLYLTGRRDAALQVFRSLIDLAPQTRLDPRLVQPEVVAAFERLRLPRLRRLRSRARRAQLKRRARAQRALDRRWAILNLVPLAGQFQNGHWRKGLVLLSVELTLLAANIATYYLLRSTSLRQPDGTFVERDADGNVRHDRRGLARALMGTNYASLGLLLGTLVYGMVDGFYFHFRQNRRLRRMIERPLAVTPMPTPSGAGISLSLKF